MEKIYTLINLTVLFACVSTSCVTENEEMDGIDLRCSFRWSGEGSEIRHLTVHSWDGSCYFPTGARLTLYGAEQDCFTCAQSIPEQVMVNGKRCTPVTAPMARSKPHRSGSSTTTTEPKDVTITFTAESYSPVSRLQDSGSTPRWTYGLLAILALSVLVLLVLIIVLLLRFRRQRAYICCKPRTSPSVSLDSVIYQMPTLQL